MHIYMFILTLVTNVYQSVKVLFRGNVVFIYFSHVLISYISILFEYIQVLFGKCEVFFICLCF